MRPSTNPLLLTWIFTVDLRNDIFSASFSVGAVSMNHTPAEKVINIDYDRFHGRARTGEPLRGSFSVLQPFGIGVVEVGGIGEHFLDTGPIRFAIPGYSEYHGGTGLFRSLPFHCVLPITAAALARFTNAAPRAKEPHEVQIKPHLSGRLYTKTVAG
jgi:hypothetical protein